jgi:hypothetical protein
MRVTHHRFYRAEDWDHFLKWLTEAFIPFLLTSGTCTAWERYQLLTKKSECPPSISISYFDNLEKYLDFWHSSERLAYDKDIKTTWQGEFERRFVIIYRLIKNIESSSTTEKPGIDKEPPEPAILHLEGIIPEPDEWTKYNEWFHEFGYVVFIPALLKLPGVRGFRRYWQLIVRSGEALPKLDNWVHPRYPLDLTVMEFDNLKARQNFERSRELAAYHKALAAEFSRGLPYHWNVDYQFIQRWQR